MPLYLVAKQVIFCSRMIASCMHRYQLRKQMKSFEKTNEFRSLTARESFFKFSCFQMSAFWFPFSRVIKLFFATKQVEMFIFLTEPSYIIIIPIAEVKEYAQRIGIKSDSDPHFLTLAKQALLTPLPSYWTPM